jgi:outer membrane protein assembly factor BamB
MRVSLRGAWSVLALTGLVNAGCFATQVPPQPTPEQVDDLPFESVWEEKAGAGFSGAMVVTDSVIYAGSMNRKVYAIEKATGKELWNKRLAGAIVGGVGHSGDTLFIATDRPDGRIRAVQFADGKEVWEVRIPRVSLPLLVIDNKVIVHASDGVLYAFRTSDGQYLWESIVGTGLAGPQPGEGSTLVATTLDSMFRVSLDDGRVLQRRLAPGTITSEWIASGPYLIGGSSANKVVKLDGRDLSIVWEADTGAEVLVSPLVSGDTVYAVTRAGNLYRIEPGDTPTAELIAQLKLPVTAPVTRFQNWLMIGGADGILRAIEADGSEAWRLAVWQPVAVPPVVLDDGFVVFGGVGDAQRFRMR